MSLANATLGQLLIPVDDLARGVAFYRDVLGLPLLFTAPPQAVRAEPHVVHRTAQMELWLAEFTDPDGNALALMSEGALPAAAAIP